MENATRPPEELKHDAFTRRDARAVRKLFEAHPKLREGAVLPVEGGMTL